MNGKSESPALNPILVASGGPQNTRFKKTFTAIIDGANTLGLILNEGATETIPAFGIACSPELAYTSGRGVQPRGIRVQDEVFFLVHTERTGDDNMPLEVKMIRSDGEVEKVKTTKLCDNVWKCSYVPQRPGKYSISVRYGNKDIQKSPFDIVVGPLKKSDVVAFGPGLHAGVVNQPNVFTVSCKEESSKISFSIEGPSEARMECFNNGDVSARVTYWVGQPGEYAVHITYDDEDIPNSPYMPQIYPDTGETHPNAIRIHGPGIEKSKTSLHVGKPVEFYIEGLPEAIPPSLYRSLSEANLESVLRANCWDAAGNPVPMKARLRPDGSVVFIYTPTSPGTHTITATVGNMSLKGMPYRVYVSPDIEPDKVKMWGPGLENAVRNQITHFFIDPREALGSANDEVLASNPISLRITDGQGNTITPNVIDQTDGTYRVEYTPTIGYGDIRVDAQLGSVPISKIPIRVPVKAEFEARRIRIQGLETRVYRSSYVKFVVDASAIDQTSEGTVEAILTDPDKKRMSCQVQSNNDGTYSCSYTPMDEGAHELEVTYEGVPVTGSPFKVQVTSGCDPKRVKAYGPGLEDGSHLEPGKKAEFTVDLTGAGQGGLGLAVEGPSEAPIECQDNRDGTCTVSYVPTEPGPYSVFVRFNDVNVPNSPFSVHVKAKVDPSKVKCSGPGLESGVLRAQWPAYFTVDTKKAGDAALKVMYRPKPGAEMCPATIQPVGSPVNWDSSQPQYYHKVTYTPEEEGPCDIEVTYDGKHVPGSPFRVEVRKSCEPERVRVLGAGVEGPVIASLPTTFTVDAREAGMGDLTLGLTDPRGQSVPVRLVPVSVDNESVPDAVNSLASGDVSDSGLLSCTYQPYLVGPHNIHVMFAGVEVENSPFTVDSLPTGRADLCQIISRIDNAIAVGEECVIPVNTAQAGKGCLTCQVIQQPSNETGASAALLPVDTEDNKDGTTTVFYTPTQLGRLDVELRYGGQLIPDGEFSQKVVTRDELDALKKLPAYRPVEFRLPAPKSDLEVECTVVRPSGEQQLVPHTVTDNNTITVSYEPVEQGMHELHVNAYAPVKPGESRTNAMIMPLQGSPYRFFVDTIGSGRVTAYGPGLSYGVTNHPAEFTVVTKDSGGGGLSLSVEGPSKAEIRCVENGDGTCNVSYLPLAPGKYTISIKFMGQHIAGSPFESKITGELSKRAQLSMGAPNDITLGTIGDDISTLTASVRSASGREEPCVLKRLPNNRLGISFTPKEVGEHLISVYRAGQHIENSPFRIQISEKEIGDPGRVRVSGPGLISGMANQPNQFTVDTREAGYAGLSLTVEGPSKAEIDCHDNRDGTCTVTYTPTEPGSYVINVKYADTHVPNSPFYVEVGGEYSGRVTEQITRHQEASQVTKVGSRCEMSLRVPDLKLSEMTATVISPSGKIAPCEIVPVDEDHYNIKFIPQEMGEHSVHVKYQGADIVGSPFQFTVGPIRDGMANKVRVLGSGIEEGVINEINAFTVYTREAGAGTLSIAIEGPSKAELDCEEQQDGSSYVTYRVGVPGLYTCSLKFNDEEIPFSPFRIYVMEPTDEDKIVSYDLPQTGTTFRGAEEPISSGGEEVASQIGHPIALTIHHKEVEGETLRATVQAPSGAIEEAIVHPIDEDQFAIRFIPHESGPHLFYVHSVPIEKADNPDIILGPSSPYRPIQGSPFRLFISQHAADPGMVTASGEGLRHGKVDMKNMFFVNTANAGSGVLNVTVDGPSKVSLTTQEQDEGYAFTYVPPVPGIYEITIKYGGNFHIAGSPFRAEITGVPRSSALESSKSEQQSHVLLETVGKTAIPRRLVGIRPENQADRVRCDGLGLKRADIRRINYFNVDASQAGSEILLVGIRGPTRPFEEVKIKHLGNNQYSVAYSVKESGRHLLMVKWGENHVPGSPFIVDVP
ncbi:unnamed protein product [Calicophoron daubneyi]|uniref:Filamin n=1 Tax=Calicophoron daubneyi TaxID=300641 RepID=A0AAV2TKK5_CALDB